MTSAILFRRYSCLGLLLLFSALVFSTRADCQDHNRVIVSATWDSKQIEYVGGEISFHVTDEVAANPILQEKVISELAGLGFRVIPWVNIWGDTLGILNEFNGGFARNTGRTDVLQPISTLLHSLLFKDIHPNLCVYPCSATPNDPIFNSQWNLSQSTNRDINAPEAWDYTHGSSEIRVAVLDSGIDVDEDVYPIHEDLQSGRLVFVYKGDYPTFNSTNSHGTEVTGVLAATFNNAKGIAPVDPSCTVGVLKIQSDIHDVQDAVSAAIEWGADIIVLSYAQQYENTTSIDIADDCDNHSVFLIAAGPNVAAGPNALPWIFCKYSYDHDYVIGVGSSNESDERTNISPRWGEHFVDLVAPADDENGPLSGTGNGIWVTTPYYSDPSGYRKNWGNSLAGPQVAGTITLMMSINPFLSRVEFRTLLQQSAAKVRPDLYTYSPTTGRSIDMGFGRLDMNSAMYKVHTIIRGEWTLREELPMQMARSNRTDAPPQHYYVHAVWDTLRSRRARVYRLDRSDKVPGSWFPLAYVTPHQLGGNILTYDDYMVNDDTTYYYRVAALDSLWVQAHDWSNTMCIVVPEYSEIDPEAENAIEFEEAPNSLQLLAAYPNPFNPITQIRFGLPEPTHVRLQVLNTRGQYVCTILDEDRPKGWHTVMWDGKDAYGQDAASGIYFYVLEAQGKRLLKKMVLVR